MIGCLKASLPMAQSAKPSDRPLSPHLQVYRWQLTMTMSILHRISGAALAVGLAVIVWILMAAAIGPAAWETFTAVAGSLAGRVALFGWSVALYYHLFNGIRHLFWDCGKLFEIRNAYLAGYLVWLATGLMTLATWWGIAT